MPKSYRIVPAVYILVMVATLYQEGHGRRQSACPALHQHTSTENTASVCHVGISVSRYVYGDTRKLRVLLHVEDESTRCWTMALVSYSAPRTLRGCTTVLVFISTNMKTMRINTHSETLANPPVPVGESIIYLNSSRVCRVWIDADTQGAVTSLGSIIESDAVSASGKWGCLLRIHTEVTT